MPRPTPRVLLYALPLFILLGCATPPNTRPPSDSERDALSAAADGQFDSALRVARMYQAWNDPRALE